MNKFNRNYNLTILFQNGSRLEIKPPLTLEFEVTRNVLTSANFCHFRILNLSEKNRNLIKKDAFDYGLKISLILKGGYENNLSTMFVGDVSLAYSVRQGVNFITEVQCFDGGYAFANSITNVQFPKETANKTVIENLIDSLKPYGVERGKVGNFDGNLTRGNSYSGATVDILNQVTGGAFFVDNGVANVLKDEEFLDGDIPVITSASGLLGTPVRENLFLNFNMLFEPRLKIGQKIKLESVTNKNFNDFYKVISLKHTGVISEATSGNATTAVGVAPVAKIGVGNGQ